MAIDPKRANARQNFSGSGFGAQSENSLKSISANENSLPNNKTRFDHTSKPNPASNIVRGNFSFAGPNPADVSKNPNTNTSNIIKRRPDGGGETRTNNIYPLIKPTEKELEQRAQSLTVDKIPNTGLGKEAEAGLGPKAEELLDFDAKRLSELRRRTANDNQAKSVNSSNGGERVNDHRNIIRDNESEGTSDQGQILGAVAAVAALEEEEQNNRKKILKIQEELKKEKLDFSYEDCEKLFYMDFKVKFPFFVLAVIILKLILEIGIFIMPFLITALGASPAVIPIIGGVIASFTGPALIGLGFVVAIAWGISKKFFDAAIFTLNYQYLHNASELNKRLSFGGRLIMRSVLWRFFKVRLLVAFPFLTADTVIPFIGILVNLAMALFSYLYIKRIVNKVKDVVYANG